MDYQCVNVSHKCKDFFPSFGKFHKNPISVSSTKFWATDEPYRGAVSHIKSIGHRQSGSFVCWLNWRLCYRYLRILFPLELLRAPQLNEVVMRCNYMTGSGQKLVGKLMNYFTIKSHIKRITMSWVRPSAEDYVLLQSLRYIKLFTYCGSIRGTAHFAT